MKKKLLLLNPPGDKIYFRDYYCSKISKAGYYYHPLDLVYLSGILKNNFEILLLDAIAEKMPQNKCLEFVEGMNPDIIIFLISSPSYYQDVDFLTFLNNKLPNTLFIGTGDIYRELKSKAFKLHHFLDAILLDFSTDDILKYLKKPDGLVYNNIIYKLGEKIIEGKEHHVCGQFTMLLPRWDLFKLDKYNYPFAKKSKFATMLTDFGCPFKCTFCPVSTLGFKLREIDNVLDEIKLLKSLGVNEIFFRDQTFGVNEERTIELCKRIERLDISWCCFSRVDVIKEDILRYMKKSGCHTIILGIESSNEDILQKYEKNINITQMKKTIELCRKFKIKTVGTFMIGFPNESKESIINTIKLSKSLRLNYASFNVVTPRFGTKFREDALIHKWIDKSKMVTDSSKSKPIWENQAISKEIFKLHRKAILSFYLRPRYVFNRIIIKEMLSMMVPTKFRR